MQLKLFLLLNTSPPEFSSLFNVSSVSGLDVSECVLEEIAWQEDDSYSCYYFRCTVELAIPGYKGIYIAVFNVTSLLNKHFSVLYTVAALDG